MFITLLVTACVAALVAGILLLVFKALGRRPPKVLIPAAIGLSILVFVTYSRYTWADLMVARLPDSVTVIERYRESAFYEPWTYLWPRVTHFAAIDRATLAAHQRAPGVYLVEMILVAEGNPTLSLPVVVDCVRHRRATLAPQTPLDPAMLIDALTWQEGRYPGGLFDAVCAE
ncbi:hypothetical protein F1188_14015 [Roseospira marina]|uniref:Uncharacterized protein n=1 Tax=Roseospira marina TaxID=140057 RepID=A0A5M6I9G1_9PROT|nr:hypothetical protein [Roseospira marina]KAA5604926.1 hypothetical protein F1188_14015 [Roseospira marina]MBB4315270.1 hypothetical protein [Roseospira marina]MBB5088270.1 hypothetical protein [Roseospira marina]